MCSLLDSRRDFFFLNLIHNFVFRWFIPGGGSPDDTPRPGMMTIYMTYRWDIWWNPNGFSIDTWWNPIDIHRNPKESLIILQNSYFEYGFWWILIIFDGFLIESYGFSIYTWWNPMNIWWNPIDTWEILMESYRNGEIFMESYRYLMES